MSKTELINSEEDMEWLFETHLKEKPPMISWTPRSAVIHGNMDCPEQIDLYPRREPLWTDNALSGRLQEDGSYSFCGPLQREEAIKIDDEERAKEDKSA